MGDSPATEPSSGDPILDKKRREYRYVYNKLAPATIPMVESLPESLEEAAMVDGANAWQRFWNVTVPGIRSSIIVVLTTLTVAALKVYDIVAVMTGGRANSTVLGFEMVNQQQRFQSYADFAKNGLPDGQSFSTMYQGWSDTNRDTISSTLKAAGYTSDQFATEEDTMRQLRQHSQSAAGQKQALQVGHEIAAQQVEQIQKLRGLVSQQMTMMGTWYQSEQTKSDLAQSKREKFFNSTILPVTGGKEMEVDF